MKNKEKLKKKRKSIKYEYFPPLKGFDYSQTIDISLKEVLYRLPKYTLKDIKFFISRGVIRKFPITAMDFEVLKRMQNIWRSYKTLVLIASKMPKRLRQKVLDTVELGLQSQLEQWMYTRVDNLKKSYKRISRIGIVDEAIKICRLKNDKRTRKSLLKLLAKIIKKWERRNGRGNKKFDVQDKI